METISRYRQIITRVLSDLAEASARDDVEVLPLFDVAHDNYLLIDAGWRGVRRIHHIIAHLESVAEFPELFYVRSIPPETAAEGLTNRLPGA
ncbi:hypothetical protein EKD04_002435 [Chloroflexales bacterium ZM16-3]|nr:hypothetical protein [Chloroflexales bacterium ZM16-3]